MLNLVAHRLLGLDGPRPLLEVPQPALVVVEVGAAPPGLRGRDRELIHRQDHHRRLEDLTSVRNRAGSPRNVPRWDLTGS
jgi:hypothetical protein